ncbi:ABC transporter ATP-binding protein [Actinomyces sp. zg-332]|uniref:ABC transporter ATP-binding protein n=1 Tax=Actinomyces sp. zg-332 TaxID=2708340 RepID=UPI0018E08ADA|nr:ABC transporter ATP-binding protein [Actinomyces sp. zg-332]QPK94674.1 ABC transporter ATP-binding protein [Actinomyces sp. zg-332]
MSSLAIVFVVINVWLELKIPEYMSEITTLLNTKGTQASEIFYWNFTSPGSKMLLLSLISFASSILTAFFAARVAAAFSTTLRSKIFHSVLGYSNAEVKEFSVPSLLTRTTNDITQIQMLITIGLQVVTKGPIMAIWAMTKIADKGHEWLLATLVAVSVVALLMLILLVLAFPKQKIIQKMTDKLNSVTRESLNGIRVVRAYNAEKYQYDKFEVANDRLTKLNLFVNRLMALMTPVIMTISGTLSLSIYWIGAHLIEDVAIAKNPAQIPQAIAKKVDIFSDMVVFSSYAMMVVFGFMMMVMLFMFLPRAIVSANRINEVLDKKSSIEYFPHTTQEPIGKGHIEFDKVSFKYADTSEPVLENVTFSAKPGETIAFIGSTGSGKSTLVSLVTRFYDVTSGSIKIDGVDIRQYSNEDLHNKVGFIPQKPVLFSGDIKSNIDMGISIESPLNEEKIWEALELAQARNFVEEKEGKINSHVAQSGSNFSGGQKQRLAIARALARKPEILIFDDSFSALDYKTDYILRSELKEKTADMTKLIVAQRISTIMDADQILVLDEGKVVGKGTHKQLLESNEIYQEIAYSQLSKKELENEN